MDDVFDLDADDPGNLELDLVPHPRNQYQRNRRRQKCLLILRRRRTRDLCDPYDVTYEAFVRSYRLSQDVVLSLVDLLRPHIRETTSPLAVPLELKILAALSFYATGSYQTPTGKQLDVAIAQSTISAFIEEITNALNEDDVLGHMIQFPSNVAEVEVAIDRNRRLGGKIPGVIGYTDGTLVKIRKPSLEDNVQAFIGRKSFASINALVTCDRRLYISNINARFPGATNDSFIFGGSALRRRMQELYAQRPCHLMGDSGFALEPWLITPFAREVRPDDDDTPEGRFNKALCSDRNVNERCIGLLKEVFRCINDERVLHYHYEKVCHIINAVCVLHNLRILANIPHFLDEDNFRNNNVNEDGPNEMDDVHLLLNEGAAVRQQLMLALEQRR